MPGWFLLVSASSSNVLSYFVLTALLGGKLHGAPFLRVGNLGPEG